MTARPALMCSGVVPARLLKASPNACSALNLHARMVLHELCCNRAATPDAIACVASAHRHACLTGDAEGNLPLHLLCQYNGDRPDLMQALLDAASTAARRTNKDGQLPLHVFAANFAHDRYLASLQMLLGAFAEGAEVADDFGCLAVDLVRRNAIANMEGEAEANAARLVANMEMALVEAIEVSISIDASEMVRASVHAALREDTHGEHEDKQAGASIQADRKLLVCARRCDAASQEESEVEEARLSVAESRALTLGLKRLRLPVGHEHLSRYPHHIQSPAPHR